MTLQQLRYVVAIAETGSFNKAAEAMFITQPSLTNAIKELEKELDIVIFCRNGRGAVLTESGQDFLAYARQVVGQADDLLDRFGKNNTSKKKFGVSAQHYSFATKAFVEMIKQFGMTEYEFAIRETKTKEVIEDVRSQKSEIGILFLDDFNRSILERMLKNEGLSFHSIIECNAYVYIWKGHPLAQNESISFEELKDYPCLRFEQGDSSSFYFAEEILFTKEYPQTIWANDRATMLNLMIGLNGYTLCSGIICEELNGSDCIMVPFRADENHCNSRMEIGYIKRTGAPLTKIGQCYIGEVKKYLGIK